MEDGAVEIAQLVSAFPLHGKGQGFKSLFR